MPRVIISADKTTNYPGKTVGDKKENEIIREIIKSITPQLRANSIMTLSTPNGLGLMERIKWINETGYSSFKGDICIEIRINSGDSTKSGNIGWYGIKDGKKSKSLLEDILNSISVDTKLVNQGIFEETLHPKKTIPFLDKTKPIAGIVGVGVLDNNKDIDFLNKKNNLQKVGKAIAKGILKFFNITYKEPKNKPVGAIKVAPQPVPIPRAISTPTAQGVMTPPYKVPQAIVPATPISLGRGMGMGSNSMGLGGMRRPYNTDRKERTEMIKKFYVKILGREPTESDLNYFLNTRISEIDLIKKMINSQEHVDLVKARQEVLIAKSKFHAREADILMLEIKNKDKTELINNLNSMNAQKNIALTQMQKELQYYTQRNIQNTSSVNQNIGQTKYKKTFTDKFLGFFSDRLG